MIASKHATDILGERRHAMLTNRTGGNLAPGSVVAVDIRQSATESTSPETGATHAVGAATANLDGPLAVYVGDEPLADNHDGRFALVDPDVPVLVEGTTDVGIGTYLIAVNGQPHVVNQSGSVLVRACAQALEAQAADEAVLTRCRFDGLRGFGQKAAS